MNPNNFSRIIVEIMEETTSMSNENINDTDDHSLYSNANFLLNAIWGNSPFNNVVINNIISN